MIGDTNDMLSRIKAMLPGRWFGDATPVLDALLSGPAAAWSGLYALLGFVKLQSRLATATGVFLDIAAADYFGANLPRRNAETDAVFSQRLRANLIAPRATRAALTLALLNETGRAPVIFEPLNVSDTGGYNSGYLGYGVAGGWGSFSLPFQFFVKAYRPNASPVANAGGYGEGPGGYNKAPMFYASLADVSGPVTDADIYAAANAVLPVATTAWMKISN
jgi:hypothetical protein